MSSVQRKSPVFMGSILKKNLAQHHELNFKEEPNPYRFIKWEEPSLHGLNLEKELNAMSSI